MLLPQIGLEREDQRLRPFLVRGSPFVGGLPLISRSIANSSSMRRTISLAMLAPASIRNLTHIKRIAQKGA